jgi:hypothetical protein
MVENLATEIRSFYYLRDLRESIEKEIDQYRSVADEYSQWLGSFIRDMEATHGDEDWFKKFSGIQKALQGKAGKESEKGGKSQKQKKARSSAEWISYKNVMLCASEQGEAEILFDAIEEINLKIEQLNRVKATVENLEKSTIGKDTVYIAFIHDGVPEKIVLRHKREREFVEKFKFMADFSMLQEASQ